jgi:O-antigen ligase
VAGRAGPPTLLAVTIAASVGTAIGAGGGFDASARLCFAALAGAALLAALVSAPEAVSMLVRQPAIVLLMALSALSALSALWSEGAPIDALRWALVVAGYAALAIAAGAVVSRAGAGPLAAGIATVATVCAVIGLTATALHAEPSALLLDGAWRPAGPFEYPPALAMLQVGALPILLWAVARCRGPLRAAAALSTVVALATVVLSGSRLQLGFAFLLLLGAVAGAHRGLFRSPEAQRAPGRPGIAVVVIATLAACLALASIALSPGQDNGPLGVDLSHGRGHTWSAAVETARERPWLGSGAETFELASASNQGGTALHFAHNLPLEAWAELGVTGLALVIGLYVAVGAAVWRVRHLPEAWLFGPGATLFLVANLFDWPWHLAGLGAVWAVCLGAILARISDRGQISPSSRSHLSVRAIPSARSTRGS